MNVDTIFDFTTTSNLDNWTVINDGVMGGRSFGSFSLSTEGHGVFKGTISLENNGGFSSVRHRMASLEVSPNSKIRIKLKGDGSNYQFRVKNKIENRYSYIQPFRTTGEWEEIEIELSSMYPGFRGRRLDRPNFSHQTIEEITFLIGNKKAQGFKLLIDHITLVN
ncbi:CIA30 family protein [Flagellimonas allohymeniacidonis]|uniref:CIA30 family protein n=2 Tax=Flagellimonas allohymeniacidonis TaxID=2517819 RepID=A0A4Q8QJ00_9FLAO|nr:CIA30 family protein [Allomuricauda hymeniacidonis]